MKKVVVLMEVDVSMDANGGPYTKSEDKIMKGNKGNKSAVVTLVEAIVVNDGDQRRGGDGGWCSG